MPASQPANFNLQEFSDAGLLLFGGRLYTYAYGTTAQKTAYTDPAGTIPHTYTADGAGGQYIALNARGELPAPLYLAPGAYDLALKRGDGSTVWARRAEPVGDGVSALAASIGSSLIGFIQFGVGALLRTLQDKLRDTVSVKDFGAAGDGVTDDATAIENALNSGAWKIIFPKGQYKVTRTIYIVSKLKLCLEFENSGIGSANVLWYGPASSSGSKYAVFQFYGPNASAQNLNFSIELSGISIDGFAAGVNRAAIGIAFGDLRSNYNELAKNIHTRNVTIANCRVGVMFGMNQSVDADIANHVHTNWKLYRNLDYGILAGSVNLAGINFIGADMASNGYAPTNDAADIHPLNEGGFGANVALLGGELVFTGGQSNHAADVTAPVYKPTTADFYVPGRIGFSGTSLKIFGWWSDVWGKFLYQVNDCHCIALKGVRHWEGAMNDGTTGFGPAATPVSIDAQCKVFIDGCYFFGDVVSNPGMGGSVSSIATNFHADLTLRPALGQGTFKGGQVNIGGPRKGDAFFSELSAQAVAFASGPELPAGGWTNGTFNTFTFTSASNVTSAINAGGAVYATSGNFADGPLLDRRQYKVSINLTLNSGQGPLIRLQDSASVDLQTLAFLTAGANNFIVTGTGKEVHFSAVNTLAANWSATFSVAQIPLAVAGPQLVAPGTSGGILSTSSEAVASPSGGTNNFTIPVNVPGGCVLKSVQLHVDNALTAGETWSAAYSGGSVTSIVGVGQPTVKNTAANKLHIPEVPAAAVQVKITRDAGNFTNGVGLIRAIVYFDVLNPMSDTY